MYTYESLPHTHKYSHTSAYTQTQIWKSWSQVGWTYSDGDGVVLTTQQPGMSAYLLCVAQEGGVSSTRRTSENSQIPGDCAMNCLIS